MSETTQTTVFGEPLEETISFTTTGRVIRPFKQMIDQIADEYKLQFDDGIHVSVVDSANVMMGSFSLKESALETADLDETIIGASSTALGNIFQHARYGATTDDTIQVVGNAEHLESTVQKTVGDTEATFTERSAVIDPMSIRETPDIPDIDTTVSVDIDPRAFIEVLNTLDDGIPTQLRAIDGEMQIKQKGEVDSSHVSLLTDATADVEEWTFYTTKYLNSIAKGLHSGYVDDVTLRWSEEIPLFVEFEREGLYNGVHVIAPRISD